MAVLTASALRKAAVSATRFVMSAVQTAAGVFFVSKDTNDMIYDSNGLISREVPLEEKFICLPCIIPENEPILQVAAEATDCCAPPSRVDDGHKPDLQGAVSSSGMREMTNLHAHSALSAECDTVYSAPGDIRCSVTQRAICPLWWGNRCTSSTWLVIPTAHQ